MTIIPEKNSLKSLLKSIAALDAIISPEWEYRYYSYDAHWSDNEEMASMRNGSGTEWFIWFKNPTLCGFKYFDPNQNKLKELEKITCKFPAKFNDFIKEPAFSIDESTVLGFNNGTKWELFGEAEGDNLKILEGDYKTYLKWASEYYEKQINENVVKSIFQGTTVTKEMVKGLNPGLGLKEIKKALKEIDSFSL